MSILSNGSRLRVRAVLKTWKCPDWRCIQNEGGVEFTFELKIIYPLCFVRKKSFVRATAFIEVVDLKVPPDWSAQMDFFSSHAHSQAIFFVSLHILYVHWVDWHMQVCLILHLATCQKAGVALFNKCVGEKRDCKKTSQSGWLTRVEVGRTAFLKLGRLRLRKTRSNVTLYTGPLLKWAHSAQLNELVSAFCFNFDIFAFATWLPFRWLAHKLECLCVYIYICIYI